MPIDGVVVNNIVYELNKELTNGKIDKITQPENDEIIFTIRNNGKNYKLLLSSSPNYPRVCIADIQKQNPINAPMFCMVLRKYISGGRIVSISQYNLDRVIKINIECYDELGELSIKTLICEIMGRHSNIILTDSKGYIYDSIKHITPDMSSFRQVLPGLSYKYPPGQDKLNPLDFNETAFRDRIKSAQSSIRLGKFLIQNIDGFSTITSREICFNSGLDESTDIKDMDTGSIEKLMESINSFIAKLKSCNFTPCIYYNESIPFDFYSFKLNYLKFMEADMKGSISETIEGYFHDRDSVDRIRQKSSDVLRIINTNLDRCYKKLSFQEEKLLECEGKDKWKLYGDLIMANLYTLKKGDTKAILSNFYDENWSSIEIPLDMTLTPAENGQKYYKKYNKEKSAQQYTLEQKKENLEEIEYLESQLVNLENCTEDIEIDEIRSELISTGYIRARRKSASRKQKPSKPMHYMSSEGIDIYVGKNNVQNDYLTLKFAGPGDIWMHTKKIPGSHVIIKHEGRNFSEKTLTEGAALAAYFSKAKDSSNVPVDYTERKNVKKPSGAKPGMVIYYTNRTIYVTPEKSIIDKIKTLE